MSTTNLGTNDVNGGITDVPLIVEDLLCRIEVLRATNIGDPAAIADLWAQVDLLRGR